MLGNLNLMKKAGLMGILVLLCMAGIGIYAIRIIKKVEVNGPIYNKISTWRELKSSVDLPSLHLIEFNALVTKMLGESDPDKLIAMIEDTKARRKSHKDQV